MVNFNDRMAYRNVVSKSYVFNVRNTQEVVMEFIKKLYLAGKKPQKDFFYVIKEANDEGMVLADFFVPIDGVLEETSDEVRFYNEFVIENMVSECVYTELEVNTPLVYDKLENVLREQNCKRRTPMYNVVRKNMENEFFIEVKAGYSLA